MCLCVCVCACHLAARAVVASGRRQVTRTQTQTNTNTRTHRHAHSSSAHHTAPHPRGCQVGGPFADRSSARAAPARFGAHRPETFGFRFNASKCDYHVRRAVAGSVSVRRDKAAKALAREAAERDAARQVGAALSFFGWVGRSVGA